MKLRVGLFSLLVGIFRSNGGLEAKITWNNIITSKYYKDTKLVLETENPFPADTIGADLSEAWARMICAKKCANNNTCLGFNFYSMSSRYVCEYLPENFCFNRQRIALQIWPGGTIWDKISSKMTTACIEQKFATITSADYCKTGRYGCRTTWPNCDTCVKTCSDCKKSYSGTSGLYNCTLWPEGPFQAPIFGFCDKTATFVAKRDVDKSTGLELFNYFMSLYDMYRISKLQSYNAMVFNFQATDGTKFSSIYENFVIDSNGNLMNMVYKSANDQDGFGLGRNPLKPSPFVIVSPNSSENCGSFWFLNSIQSSATQTCPGGGVGMLGEVNISSSELTKYGIRWPQAQIKSKKLNYADIKLDV